MVLSCEDAYVFFLAKLKECFREFLAVLEDISCSWDPNNTITLHRGQRYELNEQHLWLIVNMTGE